MANFFDQFDTPDQQAPTQASPPPPAQSAAPNFFDQFDEEDQPQAESATKTFGRAAAHGVVPGAGAIAGAELGAELGAFGGPIGSFAGAVLGGLGGAYAGSKAQQVGMDELGYDDSQQMAANAREHPIAEFAGEMAPAVATMRPDRAATISQRALSGAVMGGLEGVQEYENEGSIDPAKVLAAGGIGAALPSANRVGEAIGAPARRFGSKIAGRPNVESNPGAAPAQDEAQSSQQPPNEGEAAFVQPAPSVAGDTVGNPQSQPTRSDRVYPKGTKAPASAGPDMLTQGEFPPDIAAALEGFRNFKPEAAPSPNDIDQSLKTAPIETGFPAQQMSAARAPEPEVAPAPQQVAPQQQPVVPAAEAAPQPESTRVQRVRGAARNIRERGQAPMQDVGETPVFEPPEPPQQTEAASEVHPVAQKVAEVRDDVAQPTPAQAEAGNFAKGHPGRLFGREVSIETPKGGVREDTKNNPPAWRVDNFPYDYGEFLGTKGADGDRVDVGVVGTGDRHFVIDQKDPETGKFDEHKVMAYAKDPLDALDHYYQGFTDGSGESRVLSIKEATADELRDWLAKPGKKTNPFDESVQGQAPSGPTEGEKPLPKVVTAAVTKMKAAGLPQEAVDKLMAMEPSARLGEASKYVNETAFVPARPDRIRTAAPVVEGIKNDAGEPVTARDKADAARKSADVKAMNDAYAKLGDVAVPTTPEEKAALRARLQTFLDDTKAVKYRPAFKHEPYVMARAAKKLLTAKNPTDKGWQAFVSDALTPNEARATQRIESDIGLSKRSGDQAIANAEAARAHGTNEVEDEMLAAIDRARESEFKGDIPHEEAEAMVKPERVAAPTDLQRIEGAKDHIDLTEPGGRKQLAEQLAALPRSKEKGGAVGSGKGPIALAEGSTPEAPKASEVRKIDVKSLPPDYVKNLMERASRPKQSTRLDSDEVLNMLKDKSPTIRGLGEAFMRDEGGAVHIDKIMRDLKNSASKLGVYFKHEPRKSYIARDAKSVQEEYARSLSDELFKLRQGDVEHQIGLKKWAEELPPELNNQKTLERMYYLHEAGKTNLLDPREQALYDKYLKPVFEQNDKLYKNIQDIDPWRLGPKVENHIYRITKGDTDEFNMLKKGESADPIEGVQNIATAPKGTMLNRRFFAFEQNNSGNRFVASHNDDGYTIWHNRKPIKVVDPDFKYAPGGEYKVGPRTFTMKEAMTPEIEQHALFDGGKKAQYYHNAALSAAAANYYLGAVARHLQFLDNLKKDADFRRFAVPPGAKAPDGFVTTSLANFKGWKMHPQLAHVLNDYAQPGVNEDAINTLRKISQGITKAIFWMPTAHIRNVAEHWFVGRGFRWLPFSGGYKSLAEDGLRAIKSVVSQDELQSELRRAGAGTIYGGVINQGFMDNLAKGLGEAVAKNPSKWDPIARQFGLGPSDLVRAVYRASSKVMWAANDMFLTHAILENQRMGMSLPEAITQAERHIPNYRIPATIMGSGRGARIFAQIMSEPTLTVFGRYHYGVFNSYANIAKDLVRGNGAAKLDAAGNLFAMGLLAFAAYPMLDKAAQWLTGNDKASAARRGPLAIPSHLGAAARGKEDITSAARSTFTLSPLLSTAIEQLANKDYRDKPIIERGDVEQAARGSARAVGRVGVQEGEFLARGLVSPYSTLASAIDKGGGVGSAVRDQALDLKTPSPRAIKYGANSTKYNQRHARQRERAGSGPLENLYNKVTR